MKNYFPESQTFFSLLASDSHINRAQASFRLNSLGALIEHTKQLARERYEEGMSVDELINKNLDLLNAMVPAIYTLANIHFDSVVQDEYQQPDLTYVKWFLKNSSTIYSEKNSELWRRAHLIFVTSQYRNKVIVHAKNSNLPGNLGSSKGDFQIFYGVNSPKKLNHQLATTISHTEKVLSGVKQPFSSLILRFQKKFIKDEPDLILLHDLFFHFPYIKGTELEKIRVSIDKFASQYGCTSQKLPEICEAINYCAPVVQKCKGIIEKKA